MVGDASDGGLNPREGALSRWMAAGVISPEYGSGRFWDAEAGCYYGGETEMTLGWQSISQWKMLTNIEVVYRGLPWRPSVG